MKIKKGTIVRAVVLCIVIINMFAKMISGTNIFLIEEGTIAELVEMMISVAVIITGYWKNNSYSKNALKADAFLKQLKENEKE